MNERIDYIDIAKGLAIILVVMGHILQVDLTGESRFKDISFIYSFHMPVFMALSGFVVGINSGKPKRGFARTALRRFQQLAVPFFVWGIIVMPILNLHTNLYIWKSDVVKLLSSPDYGAWFLISLFGIHLSFLFAKWLTAKIDIKSNKLQEVLQMSSFFLFPIVWKLITSNFCKELSGGG